VVPAVAMAVSTAKETIRETTMSELAEISRGLDLPASSRSIIKKKKLPLEAFNWFRLI
jgi:hypothetical protein